MQKSIPIKIHRHRLPSDVILLWRLESVPDMNYDALDPVEPKGEVLIRGPLLFQGYYKDKVKTDEVLEKDGWFHSGEGQERTPKGTASTA